MFTGIIKTKGEVAALDKRGGDVRLSIRSRGLCFTDFEIGESTMCLLKRCR
jgi:riboflavin synthase